MLLVFSVNVRLVENTHSSSLEKQIQTLETAWGEKHYHGTDNILSTLPLVFLFTLHQAHNRIHRQVTAKEVNRQHLQQ